MIDKHLDGWDYFDRFYCISLEKCHDRRKNVLKSFSKVGLTGKVDFVLVKPHPINIEQGMYESHMTCLRRGLECGAKNIVVFEDDVIFDRYNAENFKKCTQFLSEHPEWKVLLLGALIRSSRKTTNQFIQKVRYRSLAHAYALNRSYAETIAYEPWQGIVIDSIFCPLKEGIYSVYPMFAFQKDFSSDNDKKYKTLESIRRLCGGLEHIQKVNEFYNRHKLSIFLIHIIFIAFMFYYYYLIFK